MPVPYPAMAKQDEEQKPLSPRDLEVAHGSQPAGRCYHEDGDQRATGEALEGPVSP